MNIQDTEGELINLTYIQAFLRLTVDMAVPTTTAIDWLHFLSNKHPTSRLAVHANILVPREGKKPV